MAEAFYQKYPNELARLCADAFPVKEKIVEGKTIIKHDTSIIAGPTIPCPTAAPGKTVYVKCPPSSIIRDTIKKTDTIFQENTARADGYRLQLLKSGNTIEEQEKQIEAVKTRQRHTVYWVIALGVAFAASIALRFVTFKIPFIK